jgi:hypothetical protein
MAAVNFSIKVVDQNGSSLSGMRIELYIQAFLIYIICVINL